jgi:alkyldihydroxyacetonephosphate synthase
MKRWNGWGDAEIEYPLPDPAAVYLARLLGEGAAIADAPFERVAATVPPGRLPAHPLVTDDPVDRLRHARGQSLPDWIALRYGHIGVFPDGVAYPTTAEEVRTLLAYVQEVDARLIPYGGGTSVVGHINPLPDDKPVLTLDLSRLNQLLTLDETSRLATFEAGARGPELEAQLGRAGYTLGHFPQSFEYATLGGWIATRSSGQQSYYYGRIEDLFAGGRLETPLGALDLPPLPASGAGPDLRHLVLGSEGRLGVITQATVRIRPSPPTESFHAVFFDGWERGVAAVRAIAQADTPISMARLSDAQETETTLALAGHERLVTWAERGLRLLNYGPERCLLIFGVTGDQRTTAQARRRVSSIARAHGGLPVGPFIGRIWRKSRFRAPYLRNSLWEKGYALDTVETAVPWSQVLATTAAVKQAIHEGLAASGEKVLVFAHLSHLYGDGASIYITYLYRRTADPDETFQRWQTIKAAASQAIVNHGGTISHQHGVGLDHRPYLSAEKGAIGMGALQDICRSFDPEGRLNPAKLLETA